MILGARRADQLQDNLAAADLKLTDEEIKRLDEVSAIPLDYPGWMLPVQASGRFGQVQGGIWASRLSAGK